MTKTVDVPCPECGIIVPVEITDKVVYDFRGEPRTAVEADKFEPWSHGLACEGRPVE